MFYQKVLKPIFFKFDPENVHNLMVNFGELLGKFSLSRRLISLFYGYRGRDLSKTVDGLTYRTPFILSAGFDYNGRLVNILPQISLGGIEVGSVTARPCAGNPKPRLTRLINSQSILVNKGLLNDGVDAVIKRLKKYKKPDRFVIGVSIARTNDEKSISTEAGIEDYFYSFKRLNEENVGDYYTLNISCPNAFGGESFCDADLLPKLLSRISEVRCDKPVYVKLPINMEWSKLDQILKILSEFPLVKGVIVGNLNKDYNSLEVRSEAPKEYLGGLSGKPCAGLSTALIKKIRGTYGRRFTIIGCGGVLSAEEMNKKFEAGADLIHLITGLIFNGPGFVKDLCREYSKL